MKKIIIGTLTLTMFVLAFQPLYAEEVIDEYRFSHQKYILEYLIKDNATEQIIQFVLLIQIYGKEEHAFTAHFLYENLVKYIDKNEEETEANRLKFNVLLALGVS